LAKVRATLPKGTPIEIWFQDEARVGRKNKITRRWAKRGTRPSAPKDQRTKSACIFGAICPEHGKGAGLVLPFCNTETMSLHLTGISLAIAPGAHAVVLMDQAGWHMTGKLVVPDNISIIALPAKCPELNPVENIRQFMRDNWLSNRVFTSYDNIVDHCCVAWNNLVRSALAHHDHRATQMGRCIIINAGWYQLAATVAAAAWVSHRPPFGDLAVRKAEQLRARSAVGLAAGTRDAGEHHVGDHQAPAQRNSSISARDMRAFPIATA